MLQSLLHFVYGLTDPRLSGDLAVRYVGVTTNPNLRYQAHLACSPHDPVSKNAWVQDVRGAGLEPGIVIFETFLARKDDKTLVKQREVYWINHYSRLGADLLNVQNNHSARREVLIEVPSEQTGDGIEVLDNGTAIVSIEPEDFMHLLDISFSGSGGWGTSE